MTDERQARWNVFASGKTDRHKRKSIEASCQDARMEHRHYDFSSALKEQKAKVARVAPSIAADSSSGVLPSEVDIVAYSQQRIETAFHKKNDPDLTASIALFILGEGLPFITVEKPSFQKIEIRSIADRAELWLMTSRLI